MTIAGITASAELTRMALAELMTSVTPLILVIIVGLGGARLIIKLYKRGLGK